MYTAAFPRSSTSIDLTRWLKISISPAHDGARPVRRADFAFQLSGLGAEAESMMLQVPLL